MWQKIRTIELDGKTVKLQIVCLRGAYILCDSVLTLATVGYRWSRALPNHHILVLPRRPRYLRRLRCH
jgi:hypothetical protein